MMAVQVYRVLTFQPLIMLVAAEEPAQMQYFLTLAMG
jgi:hypothetical protein